jgi:CheY-like chemotaxis protein
MKPMNAESILFVDGDPRSLRLIESVLEQSRATAHYAENGVGALQLLRHHRCGTMVTSLIMDGMNGYELSLLALKRFPDLKIFLASEVISPEVCHLAADVGIARVFSKPWTTERIRRVVATANWDGHHLPALAPQMLRQRNALW